jgi:3-deoxy-manno-octulosonate cytidylyltransferase (CMP-KDO synthetase)
VFKVVIPARYAATRLPGKPLLPIAGRPMVQWVHDRAVGSGAAEVWVATDDERIEDACRAFGARVARTSSQHPSGTDRIAELAVREQWGDRDIVVNVQSDEPLLPSALIRQVAELLEADIQAGVATLGTPVRSLAEFMDPNVVKVAFTASGRALYFSRAPIPWPRDGASGDMSTQTRFDGAIRHIGLYAYRVEALKRLAALAPTALELSERLEQLRALEHGIGISVALAQRAPGPGVDTEKDLETVRTMIEARRS